MKSGTSSLPCFSLPRLIRSAIILGVLFAMTAFLLSLRDAHAAATTFTVNSLDDTDDGNCDSAPDCTLREAINAANDNPGADTINFTVTGIINLTGPLANIIDDVTINGPGSHLLTVRRDTGGDYRIFNVTASGMVTFLGLTIKDGQFATGKIGENGGAAINNASSGTVNVINCTLTQNSTVPFSQQSPFAGAGGAIFNGSGTLTVTNSTLSNNSTTLALASGGAIYNGGTAIITNSVLRDNTTAGANGGAILNLGSMAVESSTISENSATLSSGGGIYNEGTLDVAQSTLRNNSAFIEGGGIYNEGGMLKMTNSTLNGNSASEGGGIFNLGTANVTSSTLSGNSGSDEGGGVFNLGSMTVHSSIIALNTAPTSPNLSGSVTSLGYNVVGDSTFIPTTGDQIGVTAAQLKLGPLANNGGPTQTMELCMDSVAIDAGDNAVLTPPLSLTTDQRGLGFRRRIGLQVDVGAYEVRGRARLCP